MCRLGGFAFGGGTGGLGRGPGLCLPILPRKEGAGQTFKSTGRNTPAYKHTCTCKHLPACCLLACWPADLLQEHLGTDPWWTGLVWLAASGQCGLLLSSLPPDPLWEREAGGVGCFRWFFYTFAGRLLFPSMPSMPFFCLYRRISFAFHSFIFHHFYTGSIVTCIDICHFSLPFLFGGEAWHGLHRLFIQITKRKKTKPLHGIWRLPFWEKS